MNEDFYTIEVHIISNFNLNRLLYIKIPLNTINFKIDYKVVNIIWSIRKIAFKYLKVLTVNGG